jgi:stage II sporulation protein D
MKRGTYCIVILILILLLTQVAKAENTIKVLMLGNPDDPLPSEHAERIASVTGKVFINGQFYSGSLDIIKDEKGLYVINNLPFEKYIEGVVASEIGKDWELEALKAQAIISRTVATHHKIRNAREKFHISSSKLHQLYKGVNTDASITYAVKVTRGEIMTYENHPIKAYFHASCEGKTELPEEIWDKSYPYLKSVNCNSKNAPYESWQRKFSLNEIEKAIGISGFKGMEVSSYTASGRIRTLKIFTEVSDIEMKATEFRNLMGFNELPSTRFSISKTDKAMIFKGKGYGHGVGLSQWGALEMARQGKRYRTILSHYYPGVTIKHMEELYSQLRESGN